MDIFAKERVKTNFRTMFKIIITSLVILLFIWLCLFGTDYIMFRLNNPMVFAISKVRQSGEKHVTYEQGLGYSVIMEDNSPCLYLFGNKIR